jgi:magnesium-transporting ATPase (P-type)
LTINEYVEYEIRQFQTVERDFFINSYKRSGRYMDEIVKEFQGQSACIQTRGLFLRETQVADDTKLAQIKRLILEAQSEKSPIQRIMDRFARYFIPIILGIALVTFLITDEIIRSITILIVACPCALVLGTPTAVVAAIGNAARQGILIKGGVYLEQMGKLRTLLMDKTGTLTHGKPKVVEIRTFNGLGEKEILYWAAIAEKKYHPLLIIGNFLVEFLKIHPFQDGNGPLGLAWIVVLKPLPLFLPDSSLDSDPTQLDNSKTRV